MASWSRFADFLPKEQYYPSFHQSQVPSSSDFSQQFPWAWQYELPVLQANNLFQELPLMDNNIPFDPLYSSLNILPNHPSDNAQENFKGGSYGSETQFGVWKDLGHGALDNQEMVFFNYKKNNEDITINGSIYEKVITKKRDKSKKDKNKNSKELTREMISHHFYMPITKAAKELNVGLTLFKKRCRELGINRWPHRKLMSIQTLIKNVQDLGKEEEDVGEGKVKSAIEILEEERTLLEKSPDMKLEEKTKRLRQACFKANYKKRKQMNFPSSRKVRVDSIINNNKCRSKMDEGQDILNLFSGPESSFLSSDYNLFF